MDVLFLWLAGVVIAVAVFGIRLARTRGWRIGAAWAAALALLAIAALDPPLWRERPTVALLVDASASTRGFWFREEAALDGLVSELTAFARVELYTFADGPATPAATPLSVSEIPSSQTTLPTPSAEAIVLLSDGRFAPASPVVPCFVVMDPEAPAPVDGRLDHVGWGIAGLSATAVVDEPPRELRWPDGTTRTLDAGRTSVFSGSVDGEREAIITLDPRDRWPENDRLIAARDVRAANRVWIGSDRPPGFDGLTSFDDTALAQASVVVLNNVPAEQLPSAIQSRLVPYVRDFGGSVIIGGGPDALSSGGYGNTPLDALSPLASVPPAPSNDLFLLLDSSGSMATRLDDGRTRLEAALAALLACEATIPPGWSVRTGSIARDLRWWPATRDRGTPPADLVASGPTNLAVAIGAVLDAPAARAKRLILVSDGQADADTLRPLVGAVAEAGLVIDWLALPPADVAGPLGTLVRASGGTIRPAGSADTWRENAQALARGATSAPMREQPATIALDPLGRVRVERFNIVSLRDGAAELARSERDGQAHPLAARWSVGLGEVTTLAFALDAESLAKLARARERMPSDPRLLITARPDAVDVEARDDRGPMNRLDLVMHVDGEVRPFEQIAPGRYRTDILRREKPRAASIRLNGQPVGSAVVPGRYAAEFESIGTDRDALEALARDSGGAVVNRDAIGLIRALLPAPRGGARTPLLMAGLVALGMAVVWTRTAGDRVRSAG